MGEKSKKNQSVIKYAGLMSAGTFSSRVLGYIRDLIVASQFDNTIKDVFAVAFKLPNQFRRLFGEGALAVSFIPVFIEQLQPRGQITEEQALEDANNLKNAVFSILSVIVGVLTALGLIFMEPLLRLLLSDDGFMSVPGKFELAVNMARIMFFYMFLVINFAFFSSVLNAFKSFFTPAVAPAVFNLAFILVSLIPNELVAFKGQQLAYAVVVGGMAQLLVVTLALHKMGHLPRFYWNPAYKNVSKVFRNMVPGLIGMGVLQIMSLVNVNFASRLEEGTLGYIYFADRILELPQSLLAISLGTALLPTLSEAWAKNDVITMKQTGVKQIGVLWFLALPSAVGMYVLAKPIVEVLFMYGSFNEADAAMTAQIIHIYAFLFLIMSTHKVLVPNFYAMKNTWTPALTSAIGLIIHIVLAPMLMAKYGLDGLIYSMVAAAGSNLFILMLFYHYFLGSFPYLALIKKVLHYLPGLTGLAMVVVFAHPFVKAKSLPMLGGTMGNIFSLFSVIGLAGAIYFIIGFLVKNPECEQVFALIRRKLLKR